DQVRHIALRDNRSHHGHMPDPSEGFVAFSQQRQTSRHISNITIAMRKVYITQELDWLSCQSSGKDAIAQRRIEDSRPKEISSSTKCNTHFALAVGCKIGFCDACPHLPFARGSSVWTTLFHSLPMGLPIHIKRIRHNQLRSSRCNALYKALL